MGVCFGCIFIDSNRHRAFPQHVFAHARVLQYSLVLKDHSLAGAIHFNGLFSKAPTSAPLGD